MDTDVVWMVLGEWVELARFRWFLWAWNLLLAFVPAVLAVALFRPGVRRGVAWWAGVVAFVLFLPNAPYVLTDVVHVRVDASLAASNRQVLTTVAPLWGGFMVAGMLSYAFCLRRLYRYLVADWPGVSALAVLVPLQLLVAVGVYLGRVTRLNSWYVITEPTRVVETAAELSGVESWRFISVMTVVLLAATAVALPMVNAMAHLGRRWSTPLARAVLRAGGREVPSALGCSLVLVLLLGVGCAATDTDGASTPGGSAATPTSLGDSRADYDVEVTNGYGSGRYRPGETVHVWSAVSPQSEVVEPWTGDASLLATPGEWRSTFVMPERDVSLTANSAPASLMLESESWEGATGVAKDLRYFVPPVPRWVVVLSHGTGGSSRFIEGVEAFSLTLALVDAGYAVVSAEAEEVAAGDLDGDGRIRWNTRSDPGNDDLRNIEVLLGDLEGRGVLPDGIPKLALGMSNGGVFSHFLGTISAAPFADEFPALRFEAVVSYCADATQVHARTATTTPSAWFMCGAEDNPQVSNGEARATEEALRSRGVPTDYVERAASPLYPERFARVDGIDEATSTAMVDELRDAGFVDPAGLVTVDADDLAVSVTNEPETFPVISSQLGSLRESVNQLKVTRAEHSMYSDLTGRTVEFFDRFVPSE